MKRIPNIIYPAFAVFALACFALAPQARAVCREGCDTGNDSTFMGDDALTNNTSIFNTAVGSSALLLNTTGYSNTATGSFALENNDIGYANTATGAGALFSNTEGNNNTATGRDALDLNQTGSNNTATGADGLFSNDTGSDNTATGSGALESNQTGDDNTATGFQALGSNTTGHNNTAIGDHALFNNTIGSSNIAVGTKAGFNVVSGSNNISIGAGGGVTESDYIRIGTRNTHTNAFIAGIWGRMITNSAGVIVDSKGHLGTIVSSERYKAEIKAMDKTSEAIFSLQPVTFHYKKELDPEGIPQFGLVAEQVEKINRDLVVRDDQGKPYTVRYEAVNAMLLNEFLKEHRKVEQLEKQVAALTAGFQKVSTECEMSKPALQTAANNQ